ncbi:hypothetical protein ACWDZ8_04560, partial [Streptomyces sp. NPDC003233]
MPSTESDRLFGVGPSALSGPTWGTRGMIRIKARAPTARGAVLPTVWGAVAVAYKFGCPLAQQNGLGARIVTLLELAVT